MKEDSWNESPQLRRPALDGSVLTDGWAKEDKVAKNDEVEGEEGLKKEDEEEEEEG